MRYFIPAILILSLVWVAFLFGHPHPHEFAQLGIYPRRVDGLLGILTAPFVHGSWEHIIFNSSSFLVLTTMLFYFYKSIAARVFVVSFILTGLLTWLFARPSYHIGISGVIYAEFGFIFLAGFLSTNRALIVASLITTMFYGGMIWGVLPGEAGVSWESHLFGFLVGIFCIFLFNKEIVTAFYKFKQVEEEEDEYMVFDVSKK